jgi:hypothetical protein
MKGLIAHKTWYQFINEVFHQVDNVNESITIHVVNHLSISHSVAHQKWIGNRTALVLEDNIAAQKQ